MKIIVSLVFIVYLGNCLLAQNQIINNLKHDLEFYKQKDTVRVKLLYDFGKRVFNTDHSKGISTIHEGVDLSSKLHWKKGEVQGLVVLVSMYSREGKFDAAVTAGLSALKILETIDDIDLSQRVHGSMGDVYRAMGNYDQAEFYLKKALVFAEASQKEGRIMVANMALATLFAQSNNWAAFDVYLEPGLKRAIALNDTVMQARAYEIKAGRENYYKSYAQARDNYLQNLRLLEGRDLYMSEAFIKSQLGIAYANLNNKDSALYYINEAFDVAQKHKLNKELRDAYYAKYYIYINFNDYEKALRNYLVYDELFKKDFNMQSARAAEEIRAKFEAERKDGIAKKELEQQKLIRNGFIAGFVFVFVFAVVFFSQRNKIKKGKKQSDELLLNILPEEVAEELKTKGTADAKHFDNVTVMFADFKGFTQISEKLTPSELVAEIHTCFTAFDNIITKYNIEKIKTIGDSYMCAGGLPVTNTTNAIDVVHAAIEIQTFMLQHLQGRKNDNKETFEVRIGVHSGPVVAGIVGVKKFAYDIWGDTVNIASRMESSGEAGKVNISGSTYELVRDKFTFEHRGKIQAKNKGEIDMYFVEGNAKHE